ncbi:hypothetical protein TVAG_130070 [Trichomonas vaginalis G3]|uniref:Uncharacterized protein n=1 Tax=Trichomonas vaginalis (strain ATCC PRA-98 / G3) TaxID=412133 RepID=A2DIA3_TRIV3|nr:hypothetical protein TVAGG3_0711930 [Trichomonas vaginalis G3]EAY19899.1 hypothetical protein TVAG_130070 [Trichomonas vaginalis G3]KAI5509967.1 hypothetical protein TVAGG3_0711930 [Trichomonas vaginalis G3]|eukprot:XP_001580885.1 hypothetical protein [Trichomonas vaginalis G3]
MLNDFDFDKMTQEVVQLQDTQKKNEEVKKVMEDMNLHVLNSINSQRQSLLTLSSLCSQLSEIEDRHDKIVNNLKSLRTQLLLTSQKSQQIQQIFNKEKDLWSPDQQNNRQITSTNVTCLKAVNYLNNEMGKIISTCLHSGDMTVSTQELNILTNNFQKIISTYDQTGLIKLSDEDKIQQNKFKLQQLE